MFWTVNESTAAATGVLLWNNLFVTRGMDHLWCAPLLMVETTCGVRYFGCTPLLMVGTNCGVHHC